MKTLSLMLSVAILALSYLPDAKAQQKPSDDGISDGWSYSVGGGVIVAPTYLGDDEYQFMLVPNVRVTYKDKFFASMAEGIGYNFLQNENWRIGPIVKADFGRDEDGERPFSLSGDDTNDLKGLGDVDAAAEIGGFIEYTYKPFSSKLELRQALGGHEGFVGDLNLQYNTTAEIMQRPVFISFGPEMKFASSNYHQAYFGVDAGQSQRSGLSQYDPEGGILSYGLTGSIFMPLSQNVSTVFFANYGYLGEESGDSSLVQQRGAEEQGSIGLFVNYTF